MGQDSWPSLPLGRNLHSSLPSLPSSLRTQLTWWSTRFQKEMLFSGQPSSHFQALLGMYLSRQSPVCVRGPGHRTLCRGTARGEVDLLQPKPAAPWEPNSFRPRDISTAGMGNGQRLLPMGSHGAQMEPFMIGCCGQGNKRRALK